MPKPSARRFDTRLIRFSGEAMVASALLALAGCSGGADSGNTAARGAPGETTAVAGTSVAGTPGAVETAASVSTSAASSPPVSPSVDADQDFLRHMLDHYEAVLLIVHADMMKPEGHDAHGGGNDPGEHDVVLDAEKQKMLELLHTSYGERYSPRPIAAKKAVADADGEATLAAHFRSGVALVERSAPALKRREVRAVAVQVRATQLARLKAMDAGAPAH